MGNHHSASHHSLKPRKNVHWKSAGRPSAPGKPEIIPLSADEEPNAITLRWRAGQNDGGAPLRGYQVECKRLGSPDWIRTSPPIVVRPELVLSGLEPPHRYQFRVAALNAVGVSEYSELSDVLTVGPDLATHRAPVFVQNLEDVTALENDKTEFRVRFVGSPSPTIAWFKDDYEIFSSRRTAIATDDTSSVLVFHQTLSTDEGEIRCTATNRSGHATTRALLALEAAPKLRYPRQYEDGLLYEVNETVYLKTTIVGKPVPTVEWRHNGKPILTGNNVEITNTPKFSVLKIHAAQRSDRGEYQIHARNSIGEDTAAFLVTVTAPPEPPKQVCVTRQVDKSVTLDWEPPEDDGGCRIGNYVVEYYRTGWNVWLKATTSRKTNVTLFDLIEGSEYKFRVKAESPYGMSAPSEESLAVRIPGRPVDMEFLAVEARIINEALSRQEGEESVSPAPRRKRSAPPLTQASPPPARRGVPSAILDKPHTNTNEIMLLLLHNNKKPPSKADKRESFQLDFDCLSPPPLSLSAPELSPRCAVPFRMLRCAVSSTELLHEHAMARFYKALAMTEERTKQKDEPKQHKKKDIPYNYYDKTNTNDEDTRPVDAMSGQKEMRKAKPPEIFIKTDPVESHEYKLNDHQGSQDSQASENKWQHTSFEEDYTASTVSTDDDEYSDEDISNGETDRKYNFNEGETYNPRDKLARLSYHKGSPDSEDLSDTNKLKTLHPLPDPNFVPKPILKRREVIDTPMNFNTRTPEENEKLNNKSKRHERITILKKITKMPTQKAFPFPKLLNKKTPEISQKSYIKQDINKTVKKVEQNKASDEIITINEEGMTIIDYYGNIVKEYGTSKKANVPLCLNTDDLKTIAEKQQSERNKNITQASTGNKKIINKKTGSTKSKKGNYENHQDITILNHAVHKTQPKQKPVNVKNIAIKSVKSEVQEKQKKNQKASGQQVLLKTTERATIVIPIDYEEMEKKAKINVRTAIDYTVDVCLLLIAFWVYFFKDERLAIPFLSLIIYRQVQETVILYIPGWFRRHTPPWLKKKNS